MVICYHMLFCFLLFSSEVVYMLPEKLCWVCSMDQRMQWVPRRRRNWLGQAWLMPLPYKLLPMCLGRPEENLIQREKSDFIRIMIK